jgi:hypothetical protein
MWRRAAAGGCSTCSRCNDIRPGQVSRRVGGVKRRNRRDTIARVCGGRRERRRIGAHARDSPTLPRGCQAFVWSAPFAARRSCSAAGPGVRAGRIVARGDPLNEIRRRGARASRRAPSVF